MVDSISQQLAENARRIRERQRPNIGGAYGAGQFIHQGHRPSRQITFFDDGVRIDSEFNRYSASFFQVFARTRFDGDTEAFTRIEAFLKFESPVNEIASIVIALTEFDLDWQISVDSTEAMTQQNWQAEVGMNLIKTPLDLGETFGLDNLIFSNSNWTNREATHGTLYQTPANFDDFGGTGARLVVVNAGDESGDDIFASQFALCTNFAGHTARIKVGMDFTDPSGDFALKTDGPYFGVHLFWQPRVPFTSDLVTGTASQPFIPNAAGEFYEATFDIPSQRAGQSVRFNRVRGYVLNDNDYKR